APLGTGLVVQQTAANQFSVRDNGVNHGTFATVSKIQITGSNAADTITVDLNGLTYTGSLAISSGNGNDTVSITNESATAASVRGTTSVLPGLGNDVINLNHTGTNRLTFSGIVQVTKAVGAGTLNLGNGSATTTFAGDVTAAGMAAVNLGFGQPDRYAGNVTVNGSPNLHPPGTKLGLFGAPVPATAVAIQKNLLVNGTAGGDSVSLAPGSVTVNGSSTFLLGEGNDNLQVAPILGAVQVNGDLVVVEGSG